MQKQLVKACLDSGLHLNDDHVDLNRRHFMTGAAGLTFGVAIGVPSLFDATSANAAGKDVVMSPYVTI